MDAQSLRKRIKELKQAGLLSRASADLAGDLLDRASNQWTVFLTHEEACDVCRVTHWGSARRSLIRLKDAGLIGLHTNLQAYIYFLEPPAEEPDRAESARQRAESAREEGADLTEPRRNRALARTNCADRAEIARQRALSARYKDQDQDQLQEGRILPSYPDPILDGGVGETDPDAQKVRAAAHRPPIPAAEQVRSVGLLTDAEVGLYPQLAGDVAETYTFREIAAQVFRYLHDREGRRARSPGCIPQRLAMPDQFPAEMTIEDTESELFLRYADDADLEWAALIRRRKWIPDEYADIILG